MDPNAFLGQNVSGLISAMADTAAGIAAVELLKYFGQKLPGGNIGSVIEMDVMEPRLTKRRFLKAPRCPVCSALSSQALPAVDMRAFMPGNDSSH